ncbi:MAG: FGGY family carbohydrate kinase, partial [Chloroflexota bacterium]|nr:FGGY family carbohydrate kinase [Chloroflexota bacterium]
MTSGAYVLAIDQGTTGSAALLCDAQGQVVSRVRREIRQIYPQPGWVEHDPIELLQSSLAVAREALQQAGVPLSRVAGLGITNQRETAIVWERKTGRPVSNAIVWQCRRTAPLCEDIKRRGLAPGSDRGLEQAVREKTGLPIDAYFS